MRAPLAFALVLAFCALAYAQESSTTPTTPEATTSPTSTPESTTTPTTTTPTTTTSTTTTTTTTTTRAACLVEAWSAWAPCTLADDCRPGAEERLRAILNADADPIDCPTELIESRCILVECFGKPIAHNPCLHEPIAFSQQTKLRWNLLTAASA